MHTLPRRKWDHIISSVALRLGGIIHSGPKSPSTRNLLSVLIGMGRANSHQGFSAVILSVDWAR